MTFYDDLGIKKDATPDQIKEAYRELAKKHHPDKGGDPEMFKKVSHAYSVLSDADKRARYDNGESVDDIPMTKEAKLVSIILPIFNGIIDSRFDYVHNDIFEAIKENLTQNREGIKFEKDKAQKKIKDYNNILSRIKVNEKSTMFTRLLEDKIATYNILMVKMDEAIELFNEALVVMKECEYKTDKVPDDDDFEKIGKRVDYEQLMASVMASYNNRKV